jgi:hypothetical protein
MLFRRSLARKVGIFRNQAAFEAVFSVDRLADSRY